MHTTSNVPQPIYLICFCRQKQKCCPKNFICKRRSIVVHTHTSLRVSSFCVEHARREFETRPRWPRLGTNGPNFGHPDICATNIILQLSQRVGLNGKSASRPGRGLLLADGPVENPETGLKHCDSGNEHLCLLLPLFLQLLPLLPPLLVLPLLLGRDRQCETLCQSQDHSRQGNLHANVNHFLHCWILRIGDFPPTARDSYGFLLFCRPFSHIRFQIVDLLLYLLQIVVILTAAVQS